MDNLREKRRPVMGMERAKTVVHDVKTPSGQISYARRDQVLSRCSSTACC
jgi:hypothetical protein